MDLFEASAPKSKNLPLAEYLRPVQLSDFFGQTKEITKFLKFNLHSLNQNLILWGPPGTGKTTFAGVLKEKYKIKNFISVNAIDTGAKKIKEIGQKAHRDLIEFDERTILFIDEIHRLNKAQQDVLLPFTEKGDLLLIGATTENPSYELNSALLSRCQVLLFKHLEQSDLELILHRAFKLKNISKSDFFSKEAKELLLNYASGDARKLLNQLDNLIIYFSNNKTLIDKDTLLTLLSSSHINYDKKSDQHYDCISAFIKSIRGSDPDAAIYYLARMLKGGEDPVFIARRLIILASEDIGNADPQALPMAVSVLEAVKAIGMPEARITLAQVTSYLACVPKSNRAYKALNVAMDLVDKLGDPEVPFALRSGNSKFLKQIGYGKGYKYSHDSAKGFVEQGFLPEKVNADLKGAKIYRPSKRGFENRISEYLAWISGSK